MEEVALTAGKNKESTAHIASYGPQDLDASSLGVQMARKLQLTLDFDNSSANLTS